MISLIKKIVTALGLRKAAMPVYRFLQRLEKALHPYRIATLRFFTKSSWLSSLYYTLFSSAFRREQHAVLAGRVRYNDLQNVESAVYLLRRNVHRIEKGLIMRPRRDLFALDYIQETTDSYCTLASREAEGPLSDELAWAGDVLTTYFEATGEHPVVEAAHGRFLAAREAQSKPQLAPYRRDLESGPPVEFDDLYRLARQRRSVRWFEQRRVPRELIDRALDVAVQAPSACNRQPYRFRIFDDPERAHEVAALPMGTKGFSDNIPAVAVLVGEQSAYFHERDRHVIYIDASLAAMSFLFALETLGLSSCCINWPDIPEREEAMKEELNLRDDERVVMLIAIGYPDTSGMVPYSQKKALDIARTYDQ